MPEEITDAEKAFQANEELQARIKANREDPSRLVKRTKPTEDNR